MKQYKVISVVDWWSSKNLAKKSEDAINTYSKEGWKLESLKLGHYGYKTLITFSK